MKRLFAYLRPFMGRMSVGLAIKIAGTLVELALPYILGMILNEIIEEYALSGNTEGGLRSILIWGGVMAVCAVAALVFNIVANRMAAYVAKDGAKLYNAKGKALETLALNAAVEAALVQLGLTRDDVTYQVITLPKSGFLGIGSVPAKVQVTYEAPDLKPAVKAEAKPEKPEGLALIGIEDFMNVELRTAKVLACEPVKKAKKLLKLVQSPERLLSAIQIAIRV